MLVAEDSRTAAMIDAQREHLIYGLLPWRVAVPAIPPAWHFYKRMVDITLVSILVIVTAPIVLASVLFIVAVSRGSPIFSQARVGKDGRIFKMHKLRTMVCGAHLQHDQMLKMNGGNGPTLKVKRDPRLIPGGTFLRRYSIDELPNLWNVLSGDMSLVGPRPPLPNEVAQYDDRAFRRLTVKPGVTCLWQISGRADISFEKWIELDNQYIDNWSPMLDLKILARTIPAVFLARGAY